MPALLGPIVTATGVVVVLALTATVAFALFVGSAALVAFTVAVASLLTFGAVYSPSFETDPAVVLHETAVLLVPLTSAAICFVPPDLTVELAGETEMLTEPVTESPLFTVILMLASPRSPFGKSVTNTRKV